MKKLILSIAAIVCAASSQAQLYGTLGIGVNAPAAPVVIGYNSTTTDAEVIKGSYGKGLSPVLGVGYMVNKHVGIELGASLFLGAKYKMKYNNPNSTDEYEMHAVGVRILPAIVLKSGEADSKVRLYGRAGLILSPGTRFTSNKTYVSGNNKDEKTTIIKSKPGLGYTGAMGLSFKLNKMASIWIEANGSALSSWLKSAEITDYSENGIDKLSDITNKKWKYEDKLPDTNNVDELSTSLPLSSIGLAIGVSFTLGK